MHICWVWYHLSVVNEDVQDMDGVHDMSSKKLFSTILCFIDVGRHFFFLSLSKRYPYWQITVCTAFLIRDECFCSLILPERTATQQDTNETFQPSHRRAAFKHIISVNLIRHSQIQP